MKIYARTDENGIVTKIFSDAAETPTEADVVIEEGAEEHHRYPYEKYAVHTDQGPYKYKIVNGTMAERSREELQRELEGTRGQSLERRVSDMEEAVALMIYGG